MGVQIDALFMQDMGQENFRIEARRIDAFAGKYCCVHCSKAPIVQILFIFGFFHQFGPAGFSQSLDKFVNIAVEDVIQFVQRQVDAMIRHAA